MKKFTSLMLMLTLFVSTAMADFTISYTKLTGFWGSAVETYPEEINTVVSDNSLTIGSVYCVEKGVNVTEAGDITVTIAHVNGNHRQHILGVALKNAGGTIVYKDFHYGENPGDNNTYTLTGVAAGEYTACFYVCDMGTDQAAHYGGTITAVGNIDLITTAMNLSLGVSGNGRTFDSAKGVYEWNSGCWAVEANIPDGVINGGLQNNLEAANVYSAKQAVVIENAGTITAFFKYAGGSNRLDILGADLLKDGNVVASDYHFGYTGNAAENNMYVFNVAEAGEYELRFLVSNKQEALTSNGKITVCLISKYIDFDGAYRLNSTAFADQNLCLDVTQYNTAEMLKLQEKQEYEGEQLFIIEYTGENPYYTMRTITGKNVALSGGWNATASGDAAMSFDITEKAEGIYNIWTEKGFFGCNATTGYQNVTAENANGAPMYTNHSVSNDNLGWAFEEATDIYGFEDLQSGCAYYFQVAKSFDFMHYNADAADVLSYTSIVDRNENSVFVYYVSPNTNAKFLFNVGAQKFIGTTSTANANIPLSETPNPVNFKTTDFSTSPIMISTNGTNALNFNSSLGGFINWNGGFAHTNDKGNAFNAYDAPLADEGILTTIQQLVGNYEFTIWKEQNLANLGRVGGYALDLQDEIEAITNYEQQLAFEAANEKIAINTDSYYRLVCVAPKTGNSGDVNYNTLTFNGAANLVTAPANASNINQIFKFEDAGNGYFYLKNMNADGYLNKITVGTFRSAVVAQEEACKVNVVSYANGYSNLAQHRLQNEGTALYSLFAENHPTDATAPYACSGWEGGANSPSAWYIVPATDIEVSINEFASIYLPFAVSVEDATAYAVEETTETSAKLAVKADIPAYQGAILEGNGTATLTIIDEATTDWTKNMLKGSTVDAYLAGPAYVLSKPADSEIGFYKAKLNKDGEGNDGETHFKNNANKAYLVVDGAEGAAYYSFRFPGTTGIEEITDNREQSTVIYDLTGRRVEAITAPGIYIVNGKKVLVK